MELHTAYLGFGSNIEDRLNALSKAVFNVNNIAPILKLSPIYESEAVLTDDAPEEWNTPFLNMVAKISTDLPPDELLTACQTIEKLLGRPKNHAHWSPRIIDIDILLYDKEEIDTDRLTIPHPLIAERPFVVFPLADIAPEIMLSNEETALSLARYFDHDFPPPSSRKDIKKTQLILGE